MPDLTSHAATFRASGYHVTAYLGTIPYTEVLRGTVSATPTFPTLTVSYTNVSGSHTAVRQDMVVEFFDSTGRRKGKTRIAYGTPSSTVLPIAETSAGEINIASGDQLRVYDAYELNTKIVSATAQLLKDSRITVANGYPPPPIANAGGAWFGFVDDGQTYATVTFDASASFTVDPASSGTLGYSWSVGDGTITVGSSSTAAITVRFPVGFRHVQLTVTDSSNTKSTVRQIPVRVYDDDNTPPAVIVTSRNLSVDEGTSVEFELVDSSASLANLRDRSFVCLFEREFYGSTQASYGSNVSGRSHMKFCGYLERDSNTVTAEVATVTFSAISPLAALAKVPALSQVMINRANPTKWRHVPSLNTFRMLWYLYYWHSSGATYLDFVWPNVLSALSYRRIAEAETSNLLAQMRDIANSMRTQITADWLGRILCRANPKLLTSAQRASVTTTYNIDLADIIEMSFTREHYGTTKFVRAEGITDGTTKNAQKPVFSNAPGNAPASFGTGSDTLSKQIVDNQSDLNTLAGLYFAMVNALYNGQLVPQGIEVVLPDGYDVFDPALREFVTITLPSTANLRGVAFDTSTRWTVERVSVSYDPDTGAKEVRLTLDHETLGVPGVRYKPPQESQNTLPAFPPLDLSFPPLPVVTTVEPLLQKGTQTIAVVSGNGSLRITTDFDTPSWMGGPTWVTVNVTGTSGTWLSWVTDAFSPAGTVNGWLATTTGIYRVTDVFGSVAATLQHTFTTSSVWRTIQMERGVEGWVVCASYYGSSGGTTATYTTDGTNWTEVTVSADYNTTSASFNAQQPPTVAVSPRQPGVAWIGAFTATDSANAATSALYKTVNYGANWSVDAGRMSGRVNTGLCFHLPFNNNDDDSVLYWSLTNFVDGLNNSISQYRTIGTTQQDIHAPAPAGNGLAGARYWRGIDTSPLDRQRVALAGFRRAGGNGLAAVYVSYNGGLDWIRRTDEAINSGFQWHQVYCAGDNPDAVYLVGQTGGTGTGGIGYSGDFCATIDDRTGNGIGANPLAIIGG